MIVLESNQNHATIHDTEICPTLSASMGMGGGYIPMIVQSFGFDSYNQEMYKEQSQTLKTNGGGDSVAKVLTIYSYGFKPRQSATAQGLGYEEDISPTLVAIDGCGGGVLIIAADEEDDNNRPDRRSK